MNDLPDGLWTRISIDFYKGVSSTTNELLGQGVDKAEADADTVQSMGDFADLSGVTEPYGDALHARQATDWGVPLVRAAIHPLWWEVGAPGRDSVDCLLDSRLTGRISSPCRREEIAALCAAVPAGRGV